MKSNSYSQPFWSRVLLDAGADVACLELVDGGLDLPAYAEQLSQTFLRAACHVIKVGACGECARHYLEVADFADVGLDGGLEHIDAQRAVGVGLDLVAGSVDRSGHIVDERNDVAQEFHHAAHAHVLGGAHAEYRVDRAVDQALADAEAQLVLRQLLGLEEFLHQRLVIFGGSLDQGVVQLLGAVVLLGGDFLNLGSAAVGTPGEFLHDQYVDDRVEACAAGQRILDRGDLRAEDLAHLLDNVLVVGFFAVELVEREDYRFVY